MSNYFLFTQHLRKKYTLPVKILSFLSLPFHITSNVFWVLYCIFYKYISMFGRTKVIKTTLISLLSTLIKVLLNKFFISFLYFVLFLRVLFLFYFFRVVLIFLYWRNELFENFSCFFFHSSFQYNMRLSLSFLSFFKYLCAIFYFSYF